MACILKRKDMVSAMDKAIEQWKQQLPQPQIEAFQQQQAAQVLQWQISLGLISAPQVQAPPNTDTGGSEEEVKNDATMQ